MKLFSVFFLPGGPVFRMLFFFCVLSVHFIAWNTCLFVICLHYKSWNPCPFSTDQTVCTAQQTSQSLWKADLVKLSPGNCLAVNTHIKKLKLSASASLIFFSLLLYLVCFAKWTTFSKAIFSSCLCTEMFILPCILFQPLDPCIIPDVGTEWVAALEMVSEFF